MSSLARLLGTWFFLGHVPKGPGTAGSIGAIAAGILLQIYAGFTPLGFAILAALMFAPAVWAAGRMASDAGKKDPQTVVIDEVIGQWISIAGASALNWRTWLLAFILFRLFDIFKPPPARQLERVAGGAGIVLDDAMAGIYAAVVLYAAGWFNFSSSFLYGNS